MLTDPTVGFCVVHPPSAARVWCWSSRAPIATEQVISREALIQMRVAADRPQDIAGIQRLEDLD
jgi:hypothetical protein